jgi:hypothetical protein
MVSGFVVHGAKRRLVVDYTAQNEVLGARKFKMDTLADLAPKLKPGDALFKADVQDTYYHLRLRRFDRDKLLFRIAGCWFRPLALKCGLSPAPWLFTKFLRPVVQELRRQGHPFFFFVLGRPLRSAKNRPWGHSGEPGRCRTGGQGKSRAV